MFRAGRAGRSLTFFSPRDRRRLHQIERVTGAKLQQVPIPTSQEIIDARARRVLEGLINTDSGGATQDTSAIEGALAAAHASGLRYRDIAAQLLYSAAVPPTMQNVSDSARERMDANFNKIEATDAPRARKTRGDRRSNRYRLEVGKRDGVSPKAIVGAMTGEAGLRGADLGKINIYPSFSVVEVSDELSDRQMAKLNKAQVFGRRLRISVDEGPRGGSHGDGSRPERTYEGRRAGRQFDRKGGKKYGRPRR